jgi:predicted permease
MSAALLVLLIGCVNVAQLLSAHGMARGRELAVRAALGATRARLVRQLLTESIVLSAAGGAVGVMLAYWGVRGFVSIAPPNIERTSALSLNARVLIASLAVTVASGLLFGTVPALQATRGDVNATLRDGDRSSSRGRTQRRGASVLAVAGLTLAVALLVPAGLLLKAGARMHAMDFGFDSHELTVADVSMPAEQIADTATLLATQRGIQRELSAIPGVLAVGAVSRFPMTIGVNAYYQIAGAVVRPGEQYPRAQLRSAMPGYVETMRIPLEAGRAFTDRDADGSPAVAMVSLAFAARHWPGRGAAAAIGKRLVLGGRSPQVERTIVGVVGDTREFGPYEAGSRVLYVPAAQVPTRHMSFALRGERGTISESDIRAAMHRVDPRIAAFDVRSLDDLIRSYELPALVMPRVLAIFGLVALLLTVSGVYGMFSHAVSGRVRELGVRITLGAERADIMRLILGQSVRMIAAGTAIGVAIAALMARFLAAFLLGVSAFDVSVFAFTTAVVSGAAVVASYVPARRAGRIDPLVALRAD